MQGTCAQIVQVVDPGMEPDIQAPAVELLNVDDQYFHTIFETAAELEAFIAELRSAGEHAFGRSASQTKT